MKLVIEIETEKADNPKDRPYFNVKASVFRINDDGTRTLLYSNSDNSSYYEHRAVAYALTDASLWVDRSWNQP